MSGLASGLTITGDTTMDPGGNFYAGAFDFTFVLSDTSLTSTQYILGYYAAANASGGYAGNVFTLSGTGNSLTLSLNRVNSLTISDGEITGVGDTTYNSSVFASGGEAYTLTVGTYKVDYLGGTNGSAAADLYLDGVKVASFNGGNHNMNGGDGGTAKLTVTVNDSYVVPEPTTATLSLLALAGLAARRRRK